MRKYGKKLTLLITILLVSVLSFSVCASVSATITDEDHDPGFFDDLGILQELNKVEEEPETSELPEEERDPDENLDYMTLLNTIGVLEGDENGELNPYRSITRAELTVILLRFTGISDKYFMNVSASELNFSDVAADSWYYGAVKTACEIGMVKGYDDGTFRPDKTVSFNEAVKMVICAIGYGAVAEESGSYPLGYMTVASKLKITKNLKADKNDKTLRKTVAKMMFNALEANTLKRAIDGKNGATAFTDNGVTFGEKYFGIKKKQGIVEGVNEQMLGGVSTRSNAVYILGESYVTSLDDAILEHIGSYIDFYVTSDENSRSEIVWYTVNNKNSIVTAEFDDILDVTEEQVKLDGDIPKIKLDDEPSMIFNERAVIPFDYNLITPRYFDRLTGNDGIPYCGNVVFTDNNGDGKFDVVNVAAYESMYVGKALKLKKVVMDYYESESGGSRVIDLNPRNLGDTEVEYVMENGKEATFDSIKKGYVIDIYSSADIRGLNSKTKIVITNKSISGKVDSVDDDYVEIAGTSYKLSPYYKNTVRAYPNIALTLELGAKVKVALNSKKEVVAVVTKTSSNNMGYMLDYGRSNDGFYAEIADVDGKVKIYPFADKVKVNGSLKSDKDACKLIENTGKANAPVSFKADVSGKLKAIEIHTLKNPGLVQTVGVGKTIKFDKNVLDMGVGRYTYTFDFANTMNIEDIPIIGIDFGAAGSDNSRSPETGIASVESKNTVKIDKSYIGVNRNSQNYGNNYYEDRFFFVNYDEDKKSCDLIIYNIGSGGLEEDTMAPYTIYSGSGEGYHNRYMAETNAAEYGSTISDNILCVNKAYSMKNEDGDIVWLVRGLQGGKAVTYNTAPGMKYLTTVNAQDDRINSTAPVQWTPERGGSYESADEDEWFRVSGPKDFYNPATGVKTYANTTSFYFPERFRNRTEPGIKMGDMAYIATDESGKIVEFQYIANAVDGPERVLCGRPRRATMVRGFCWEPFYGMDGDNVDSYHLSNHNHDDMREPEISETIRTIAWDGENDEFITVTRDDIYGSDAYIEEIDNANGYSRTEEYNNCWLLMNKYNWRCTEIIFVDYISNTY